MDREGSTCNQFFSFTSIKLSERCPFCGPILSNLSLINVFNPFQCGLEDQSILELSIIS